jgi:hypothetical protein
MDKKSALKVLIEESILLHDGIKEPLINKIPSMTDEEVDKLGTFLAMEQKELLENEEEIEKNLKALLE